MRFDARQAKLLQAGDHLIVEGCQGLRSADDVRDGMGEGRVLGADAALAAKMQKTVQANKPRGAYRLGQARATLALI